jgi:S1-C subfamily serine protease
MVMVRLWATIASVALVEFTSLGGHDGHANCQAEFREPVSSTSLEAPAPRSNERDENQRPEELERRIKAVYQRVNPAVVRWTGEDRRGPQNGVIVSADGHVLIRDMAGGKKLSFELPDGRHVTGVTLGWSEEYGLGLAKLDGAGPWPHVNYKSAGHVRAGQCILALGFTHLNRDVVHRPLLKVDWVTVATPGVWFMVSEVPTIWSWEPTIVFDLDGNLIGSGSEFWGGKGWVYTDAKVIQAMWDDLIVGKNRDEIRLGPAGNAKPAAKDSVEKPVIRPPAVEKATRATVRIRREPADRGLSGVVVSADGLIATCAHHFVMPGKKVIVCFPDGRDAAGKVLGVNLLSDISLVQITDSGPWPHVEMGDSLHLKQGDPCLSVGYGPVGSRDRQPSMRRSRVVAPVTGHWEYRLGVDPTTPLIGGDSGGGIFDSEGRLVAIHQQLGWVKKEGFKPNMPHKHVRVELFRAHWDELKGAFDQSTAPPLVDTQKDLSKASDPVRHSVVEVLDGKSTVALGTIVNRDGRVLTKASVLPKAPACRLFDGRVLPATVVKKSREHDLAVLRIQASDLVPAAWSDVDSPQTGTMMAVTGAGSDVNVCFVSHTTLSIPPERGVIWTGLGETARGLEVVKEWKQLNPPVLRKGDIILSIDGHATPDRKAYVELIHPKNGNPLAIAGDQLVLLVRRDEKEVEVRLPLGPPSMPRPVGQSPRYSGFAGVFGVSVDTKVPLGGPIIDRSGRVAGVAIAWQVRGWLLVLPAATARTVIGEPFPATGR